MIARLVSGGTESLKNQRIKLQRRFKKNTNKILYYQDLPYILKIIRAKIMSKYYDNPLTKYFEIQKTWEFIAQKYYWPIFKINIEFYFKRCNVYLISKLVNYNP